MDTYTDTRGERTVGGFVFQTTEDAALASQELKKQNTSGCICPMTTRKR